LGKIRLFNAETIEKMDGIIKVFDMTSGERVHTLEAHVMP